MSETNFYDAGFEELEEILMHYAKKADNVIEILEVGASELVSDVRKLPQPRSSVHKSGYTHLLDTITYQKANGEIEVGWGKYYGPMKEKGTERVKATPHLSPTFERNKEKYYKKMIEEFRR